MANSFVQYTGDGSTTNFTVSFGYISTDHVTVKVNAVTTSFTWLDATTVVVSPAPANGATVEIRRATPTTTPVVDFQDAGTVTAAQLDLNTLQMLYISQEAADDTESAAASATNAAASATLASNYALKTDGYVSGTDNSAKSWAVGGTGNGQPADGDAKSWATKVGAYVTGALMSAKEWAVGTLMRGLDGGGSAKDWANYVGGTVDNAEYSAKKYAQDAATVVLTTVKRVSTVAALKAISVPTTEDVVEVLGYYSSGDGGGGLFYWDSASADADNGGTILLPNSSPASGRWKRMYVGRVINVRWFGAVGDGSTDDYAAIAATITLLPSNGGVVYFPASSGAYVFATALNLSGKFDITFRGDAEGGNGGLGLPSSITYTGTGASSAINGVSSNALVFENLHISYSSALFTGRLIDLRGDATRDGAFHRISNCTVGSNGGTRTAQTLVDLDGAIEFTAEHSHFEDAEMAIRGKDATGRNYSNAVRILACEFINTVQAPIQNAGEAWLIDGNVFEPLSGGGAGAYASTASCFNLVIANSWMGDATASGTWISTAGEAVVVRDNYISGGVTGISLSGYAWTITGNNFASLTNGVVFNVAGGNTEGLVLHGNRFQSSVTNNTVDLGNAAVSYKTVAGNLPTASEQSLAAASGYKKLPDGLCIQWGSVSLAGASAAVTFPVTFTTVFQVTLGLSSPPGTSTSVWESALATTGFTANVTSGPANVRWIAVGLLH